LFIQKNDTGTCEHGDYSSAPYHANETKDFFAVKVYAKKNSICVQSSTQR